MFVLQTLSKLYGELSSASWSTKATMIFDFLSMILKLEDSLVFSRVRVVMLGSKIGLLVVLGNEM